MSAGPSEEGWRLHCLAGGMGAEDIEQALIALRGMLAFGYHDPLLMFWTPEPIDVDKDRMVRFGGEGGSRKSRVSYTYANRAHRYYRPLPPNYTELARFEFVRGTEGLASFEFVPFQLPENAHG